MSLPSDIYVHIFTLANFRLSDIINLTMVSKNLRQISLLEDNWHIIFDTKKVLYNFIRKVFQSGFSISYPFNKIQKIRTGHTKLLPIKIHQQADIIKFYEHFADYQYLYLSGRGPVNVCDKDSLGELRGSDISLCSIILIGPSGYPFIEPLSEKNMVNYSITEIIVRNCRVECQHILKYFPSLEKLEAGSFRKVEYLKQSRLKHLACYQYTGIYTFTSNLPDTIESLIMPAGQSMLSDRLNKFQYLTYLKVRLMYVKLSTELRMHTVHFIMSHPDQTDIQLDLPNVENIIFSHDWTECHIENLYLTSNAVSCQIIDIKISNLFTVLPKCSGVIMKDKSNYDSDIFIE
jgi:hypothetical protein